MSGRAERKGRPLAERAKKIGRVTDTQKLAAKVHRISAPECTVRIVLSGHVQGVGFRPFIYRLANTHGLTGQVQNRLGEVEIIACGSRGAVQRFQRDLISRAPPLSRPEIDKVVPVSSGAVCWF